MDGSSEVARELFREHGTALYRFAVEGDAPAGFYVPVSCPEELSPILNAIPPQLLAHDLSLLKGLNPDKLK